MKNIFETFGESLCIFSAANNCRLKYIFCFIYLIFPRNWSCFSMLNESVFVKNKLNVIGYQEILRGELWPFTEFFIEFIFQSHFSLNWIEMEDKKTIFPIRRCSYSYSRHYAQVVSRFPKRIIIMTNNESWSESDRESMVNSSEKKFTIRRSHL